MWLWECELRQRGLRRLSAGYWQGERGHGLPGDAYLSVFLHGADRGRIDVWAFHVTFCLGVDRVHFYYHEAGEDVWEPGGHTSGAEIRRYDREPAELRALADAVAAAFVAAMGMTLLRRDG